MTFQHFLEQNLLKHTNMPQSHRFNPRHFDGYDREIADVSDSIKTRIFAAEIPEIV